jgi:hypothetical protein
MLFVVDFFLQFSRFIYFQIEKPYKKVVFLGIKLFQSKKLRI